MELFHIFSQIDNRKQMLSHIERMTHLVKSPLKSEAIPKYQKLDTKTFSNTSPKRYSKKNHERPTANSASKSSRTPSKKSSNHSSTHNSPARFASPTSRTPNFRELVLQTIQELIKVRAQKIKKNLEIVVKEVKIIINLKILVETEIKARKIPLQTPAIRQIEEKIQALMKESAEELLILENKCNEIIEENQKLKIKLDQMSEKTYECQKVRKYKKLNDYLQEFATSYGSEENEYLDAQRNMKYIKNITHLAKNIVKKLMPDNEDEKKYEGILGKLASLILKEREIMLKISQENKKIIEYEEKIKLQLEEKIAQFKDL
ncbi:hypothetical protein SteCoe_33089 [Stentor coeruleus]|uniref:Uncharacterized protein n=1 Tax=Stentor coeruleus TaxID=5963 RepID=A0A1R2AXK4_9CILI|nr:hypothetical protein SteCoe_33089 [Stentor coeruleus]